jgi:FlaG/FlaF family flagellin (archaellin)
VILAAVIASFVLGLGDSTDEVQPNTSFEFDYEEDSSADTLTITLTDGDSIVLDELNLRGDLNGDIDQDFTSLGSASGVSGASGTGGLTISSSNEMSPGQAVEITSSGSGGDFSDYEVSLVWETSENSATLEESEGPDA